MARVLIVDGDKDLRMLYRLLFEDEGYEIVDVGSGADALQVLFEEEVDAIVLELRLPDIEGLFLLDEIISKWRDLPIIINTRQEQFRNDFHSWMADDFVLKGSDPWRLIDAVQHAITQNGSS